VPPALLPPLEPQPAIRNAERSNAAQRLFMSALPEVRP
jgi:hypothetical protein